MATLAELQQQIDELLKQKEELLSKEKGEIIARIKKEINDYGLTAKDLGFDSKTTAEDGAEKVKKPVKAKYKHPATGETWSGRGIKPKWAQAYISSNSMEKFEKDCLIP